METTVDEGGVAGLRSTGDEAAAKERENELYEQIGRLKMELEWVKKSYRKQSLNAAR